MGLSKILRKKNKKKRSKENGLVPIKGFGKDIFCKDVSWCSFCDHDKSQSVFKE